MKESFDVCSVELEEVHPEFNVFYDSLVRTNEDPQNQPPIERKSSPIKLKDG